MTPRRPGSRRIALACLLGLMALAIAPAGTLGVEPATPEAATAQLQTHSTSTLAFPAGIDIASEIEWDGKTRGMRLDMLYRAGGNATITLAASLDPGEPVNGHWTVDARLDLQAQYLPVGLDISWWWRLSGPDGVVAESAHAIAGWYDDRWPWHSIESDQVVLHEYSLDDQFATQVLDTVQATISELESRYGVEVSDPLSVWIYDTNSDFQIARPPNSRDTIAALSYPAYRLIASILRNGDVAELLRVLPHEVSHHVLAQATENPFTPPPLWFDEGMATHVQTGGNDGYLRMVTMALAEDRLFSLNSLTGAFPYSPMQATLAYAASWSAIAYLTDTYGDEGIGRMIIAFANGVPYEDAIEQSLGIATSQLNEDWRAWVASQEQSLPHSLNQKGARRCIGPASTLWYAPHLTAIKREPWMLLAA